MRVIMISIWSLTITWVSAQSIEYRAGVGRLPEAIEATLTEIMKSSGATKITVTSASRTTDQQVVEMYNLIEQNGVTSAKSLYGPEGNRVIDIYKVNRDKNKNESEIKVAMKEELVKQLPSAIENNRLMHVGREAQFIVFDISQRSFIPSGKLSAFETLCKRYESDCRIHRFLGRGEAEKSALHFEFRK